MIKKWIEKRKARKAEELEEQMTIDKLIAELHSKGFELETVRF